MPIWFNKTDWIIKVYDTIRYLVLLDFGLFDNICDSIKDLITEKSSITDSIDYNFWRISISSYNSWPKEKNIDFSECYNTH